MLLALALALACACPSGISGLVVCSSQRAGSLMVILRTQPQHRIARKIRPRTFSLWRNITNHNYLFHRLQAEIQMNKHILYNRTQNSWLSFYTLIRLQQVTLLTDQTILSVDLWRKLLWLQPPCWDILYSFLVVNNYKNYIALGVHTPMSVQGILTFCLLIWKVIQH